MVKFRKMLSISLAIITASTFTGVGGFHNMNAYASSANIVKVNPDLEYQTMEGWGTSLAWWAKLVGEWDDVKRDQIMDLTFDKERGLGLNFVRYNIGGSKSPKDNNLRPGSDIESYLSEDGTYDWNKDKGQRYVLENAKSIIEKGGDTFKAEAFSNSPPYFMTKSGFASGNKKGDSNLKDDSYKEFAEYLATVSNHFKENGIDFDTIDPMNEPTCDWWKAGGNQEGCAFVKPEEKDKIYKELKKAVDDKNLNTKLSGFDENSLDTTIDSLNSASKETINTISQINTHDYSGSKRTKLRDLAQSLEKPLYMNEICASGGSSHNHDDMDNGFKLADYIFSDLREMKVPAWYIWQVVDDEKMNKDNKSNWGLISAYIDGNAKGDYYLTKQYYAMAHFSKFIRPGYKIIDTDDSNTVAAIDKQNNNLVIVAQNDSNEDKNFSFDISKFDTTSSSVKEYRTTEKEDLVESYKPYLGEGALKETLPKKSIVTFVVSNAIYNGEVGTTINDEVIGNHLNEFEYVGEWKDNSNQKEAYSGDEHYCNDKDSYYKVRFNGNKVKVYGTKGTDAGIAAISIDGGREVLVDLYSDVRYDNALMYTSPVLGKGEHDVKVRITGDKNPLSTGNYVVADRVISYQNGSSENVLESPVLNNLIGREDSLVVNFNKVDNADSYNIKYGTESNNYINIINDVKDTSYVIPNLEKDKTYYVVVSAVVNGQESNNSNELSEDTKNNIKSDLMYYVNCGDNTPDSLEDGEKLGCLNSLEDQEYKLDSKTGYKWGYLSDDDKVWSQDTQSTVGSNYGCERQYDGDKENGGINYKFEVPNGSYKVALGFYDPWSHDNRLEDVLINGKMLSEKLCPNKIGMVPQEYEAEVNNGVLDIRVQKSKGSDDKPLISWIKIMNKSM